MLKETPNNLTMVTVNHFPTVKKRVWAFNSHSCTLKNLHIIQFDGMIYDA